MSIFKESIDKYVIDQIRLREKVMGYSRQNQLNNQMLSWLNGKTAWVRMTSSVDVIDEKLAKRLGVNPGSEMAKKHTLMGGELFNRNGKYSMRGGVGSGGGAYGDKSNLTQDKYGLRPMAGITSLSIRSLGAYGSLREATIEYRVNSSEEKNRMAMLYNRPGMHVLIEWGWSQFFDNSQIHSLDRLSNPKFYNILDTKLPKEQIFRDLYDYDSFKLKNGKIAENSACYDAFFGVVKNFSCRNEGLSAYVCTVTVMSIGEVIESLKINYISKLKQLSNTLFKDYKEIDKDGNIKKAYYESKLNGDFEYIFTKAKRLITKPEGYVRMHANLLTDDDPNSRPIEFDFDIFGCHVRSQTDDPAYDKSFHAYIRLADLLRILNYRILFHDQNGRSYVILSAKDRYHNDLQCKAHYFQTSTDIRVCLIKPCQDENLTPKKMVINMLNKVNNPYYQYFFKDGLYNKGAIPNILVNVKYLQKILMTTKDSENNVNLSSFLKQMLGDINRSLGSINRFDIHVEANTNYVRIVDMHYLEEGDGKAKKEMIKLGTLDSIARNFQFQSQIFPEQSTIIAIAAQSGGGMGNVGLDSFTMDMFYKGVQDRLVSERVEAGTQKQNMNRVTDKEKREKWVEYINAIGTYSQNIDKGNGLGIIRDYDTSEALHQLILDEISEQVSKNKSDTHIGKAIIPVKLTITLDGIAGINVGQIFVVNEDVLDYDYQSPEKGKHKVGFIVRSVNHTISGNDWVTEIDTQTCLLESGLKPKPPTKSIVFEGIKFSDTNKDGK